jgi:UDP-3-O-[3-hydroxymyristoyl] glucosamine N-acyltransferase
MGNRTYFHRRLYGLCWTSVYYFTPIFFAALSFPPFKALLFRLFGYRGDMSFTSYPDTWIRDIALLELGKGAYLSNRATIGTNIAFPDGTILVDTVKIGDGALVGHLTMLAPGVQLGRNAEVGVGVAIGLKSILGDGVKINPGCAIEHGVKIGARTKVGSMTYIGSGVNIGPDLVIPAGITIPSKTKLTCQEEIAFYANHLTQAKANRSQRLKLLAVS